MTLNVKLKKGKASSSHTAMDRGCFRKIIFEPGSSFSEKNEKVRIHRSRVRRGFSAVDYRAYKKISVT